MTDALDVMHSLVIEDGSRWGDVATRLQRDDARAVLDPPPGGPRLHFVSRPKGYSKTADGAGYALAAMLTQLARHDRLYAAAASREQAALLLDSFVGYLDRTPGLADLFRVRASSIVCETTGAVLRVISSDASTAQGLRPSFVFCDEVCNWPDLPRSQRFLNALLAGLPKVAYSRAVLMSTVSSPEHYSFQVYEVARTSPDWRLSHAHDLAPWTPPEKVETFRATSSESDYRRYYGNDWTRVEGSFLDPDELRACVDLDRTLVLPPVPGTSYAHGVDVGYREDSTAVATLHRDPDGVLVLDRLRVWTPEQMSGDGFEDVRNYLLGTARTYPGRVVADPRLIEPIIQDWQRDHPDLPLRAYHFSGPSKAALARAVFFAVRERRLRLPADEALVAELASVRVRETTSGMSYDHVRGRHDDRFTAVALAVHELERRDAQPTEFVFAPGVLTGAASGLQTVDAYDVPHLGLDWSEYGGFEPEPERPLPRSSTPEFHRENCTGHAPPPEGLTPEEQAAHVAENNRLHAEFEKAHGPVSTRGLSESLERRNPFRDDD